MKNRKPSLVIIFLTVFMDLIGFGIVLPLLPRYSERFGAEGFMIGVIIASFSVMQFFLAPFWGRLSDRIGRRPVLLLSNAGSTISYALFACAATPGWNAGAALALLVFSRVFAGACGANISVASAYIADVTPPEKRSKGMALIGVAFGLGFILGPALGALSASLFGLAGPGWVAAGLCGTNFLLAGKILAESRRPDAAPAPRRPGLAQWRHVLGRPWTGLLIGLYFLATFCFASFESTLPLLVGSPAVRPRDLPDPTALARQLAAAPAEGIPAQVRRHLSPSARALCARPETADPARLRRVLAAELNRLLRAGIGNGEPAATATTAAAAPAAGTPDAARNRRLLAAAFPGLIRPPRLYFDERRLGYLFAFCGLISTLLQGGVGRLVKRLGEPRLIVGSLGLFAASLLMLPYMTTLAGLLLALALISGGSGLNRAPTLGLLSRLTPAEEQGGTLGVAQSASTLGRIFGPVFATALYGWDPRATYLAAAALAFVAAGLAWARLPRRL
jgi:MFS family permease